MKKIYGSVPDKTPEGFAFKVHFPVLAMMDKITGDHRRLDSKGGAAREAMPQQIRTQPATSSGHDGAIPSGALFCVELDDETGIASGTGFLLDDPIGHLQAKWIATQVQHKNSVDLADVKVQWVEDMDNWENWHINFTQWSIAATTFVGTPAFAEAYGELVASFGGGQDELMASLRQDEIIAGLLASGETLECSFDETHYNLADLVEIPAEIVADGLPRTPHDAYFTPESTVPHKIRTDGERIWGHLGIWQTCHDGLPSCTIIPRPTDSYASFNKPGALTDKGQVATGPIFAIGGHRSLKGAIDVAAAYGGIENGWADVRVIEGVHGPWLSGHIRPGTDPNLAYAACASRISGHWLGGRLKAIVSVNSEGYDTGDNEQVAALFGIAADGEVELVASFPSCLADVPPPDAAPSLAGFSVDQLTALVAACTAEVTQRSSALLAQATDAAENRPTSPALSDAQREAFLAQLADID